MKDARLIDADKLKDNLIIEGNLGYVKTLKDVERIIDHQVNAQPTTFFEFVDCCEDSAWVCDHCGASIEGFHSPESLGYNFCPFCGLPIEVGK